MPLRAILALALGTALAQGQTFTDVAQALQFPTSGESTRGMVWFDFDGDGDFDVYLQNQGSTSKLLRNDGTVFVNVTLGMGVLHSSSGWSGAVGDYDNDGLPDLLLGNFQGINLFRNRYPQPFLDMAGPSGALDTSFEQSVGFVDFDRDGDLDLYITKELDPHRFLRNEGDGTFTDISAATGLADPQSHSYGLGFADFDGDGDVDIFVSTCGAGTINRLFRSNLAGTGSLLFTDVALLAGVNYTPNTYGAEWADFDNDGDFDLFVAGSSGEPNHLYRNDGVLPMADVAGGAGVYGPLGNGRGTDVGDYDNDGWLDILVHDRSGPARLYRNLGGLSFVEVGAAVGLGAVMTSGYDCAFVDFDNDGDLDIHITSDGRERIYQNSGSTNHWLQVVPIGTRDARTANGVSVEVHAGGSVQRRIANASPGAFSQNLLPVHFGLGAAAVADQVRVRWLDGTTDTLFQVAAGQRLSIVQSSGQAGLLTQGLGCGLPGLGAPSLGATAAPLLGSSGFGILVQGGPAAAPVAVFWALDLAATPLALGPGCDLLLDLGSLLALQQNGLNPILSSTTGPGGDALFPLPLPAAHALAGLRVPLQAAVVDPLGPPAVGLGIALTGALVVQLGY